MTISCTQILREGERPEYRSPLSARRGLRRPGSEAGAGETFGLLPKAPKLVTEEVQRHRRRHGERLGWHLGDPGALHEQREQQQAEGLGYEADNEEADRLKACMTIPCVERDRKSTRLK